MNAIYEYILAGFMMFIMLVALNTNLQYLIFDTTALMTEEDYNMSESLIDMILLSPGTPANWGSNSTTPILFGLASQASTKTYVLDPEKVIRLDENHTEYPYISPGELRSLLGLTSDINLIIRITPIFPIEIQSLGNGKYKIIVTNHKGMPLANVNVTGYYVPESLGSSNKTLQQYSVTGIDGSCILDFGGEKSDYVLVVCADLVGVKTMQTDPPYLKVRVEGGQVIQSEVPLITSLNYTSGSFYGLNTDSAARYVEIDGFTYYFELEVWR
jgi:hypothetical protein